MKVAMTDFTIVGRAGLGIGAVYSQEQRERISLGLLRRAEPKFEACLPKFIIRLLPITILAGLPQ